MKKKKTAKKKVGKVVTKTKKKVAKTTKKTELKSKAKKAAPKKKTAKKKSIVITQVTDTKVEDLDLIPAEPHAPVAAPPPPVVIQAPVVSSSTIRKAPRRATSTTTTGNYLSKGELMKAVLESKAKGEMSRDLAMKLQLLCTRLSKHPWYARYTYIDDMQAYALMMLVNTWHKFDPVKSSNPFAFYTQCIKNSFQQYKLYEKRHRTAKDRLLVEYGLTPSYNYQEDNDTRSQFEGDGEPRQHQPNYMNDSDDNNETE